MNMRRRQLVRTGSTRARFARAPLPHEATTAELGVYNLPSDTKGTRIWLDHTIE